MSVSNKTNYNKKEKKVLEKNEKEKQPVSCHTYSILLATIFNAIYCSKSLRKNSSR